MKTLFTLVIFIFSIIQGYSQNSIKDKQVQAAEIFLSLLIKQEFASCWKLVDKRVTKNLKKDQFILSLQKLYKSLPTKDDSFELYVTGVKFTHDSQILFKSFRNKNDLNKNYPGLIIDLAFIDSKSELIAGVLLKGPNVAKDEPIRETVLFTDKFINTDSSQIFLESVYISYVDANVAIISIRLEDTIPSNTDVKSLTNKKGDKIVKYLLMDYEYKIAIEKLRKSNIELLSYIEVSFLNLATKEQFDISVPIKDQK